MNQPGIIEDLRDFKPAETTSTTYTLHLYGKVDGNGDILYMDDVNDGFSLAGCQETRTNDYHLTVTHSKLAADPGKLSASTSFMKSLTEGYTRLVATVTGTAIFYTPTGVSRVALVECPSARVMRELTEAYGISVSSNWSYTPHITLGSCREEDLAGNRVVSTRVHWPTVPRMLSLRPVADLYMKSNGVKTLVWSTESK